MPQASPRSGGLDGPLHGGGAQLHALCKSSTALDALGAASACDAAAASRTAQSSSIDPGALRYFTRERWPRSDAHAQELKCDGQV